MSHIKDSGQRTLFDTGAQRDDESNKGRFDLLPTDILQPLCSYNFLYFALEGLAKHYEAGAKKYDEHNWEKGIPTHVYFNSAIRHLGKWSKGWDDEPHLRALCWNLVCLCWTLDKISKGKLPEALSTHHVPMIHEFDKACGNTQRYNPSQKTLVDYLFKYNITGNIGCLIVATRIALEFLEMDENHEPG